MSDTSRFIVDADWLQKNIGKEGVSIIDGSWYLPAANRDAKKEYEQSHIPGAVFFDHDVICDQKSGLPHTLPDPNQFSQQVGDLGVSVHDTIVVYDGVGFFSAPRIWWMLKIMGAENVFVLNGGFDRWKEEGRPTTDEITAVKPVRFVADFHHDKVVFFDEMRSIVDNRSTQIADARGYKRFIGEQAEPRPGMRSGHMPGACSVPAILMSEGGNLKDLTTIKEIFSRAGIDVNEPVTTTCGSGVTAAVLALALESLGNKHVRLYDGSWSEWGAKTDTPVVKGDKNEDK